MPIPRWKRYVYATIAAEVSSVTRYYERVVQWMRQPGDTGFLLEQIDAPEKCEIEGDFALDLTADSAARTAVMLNGTLNGEYDIQSLLGGLRTRLSRTSRVIAILYNPYFSLLYRVASRLGLKAGKDVTTFITYADLRNLAKVSGFEIVRIRPCLYSPFRLLGLGGLINRLMPVIPLLRHLGFVAVVVLRPTRAREERPSLTIIVPARNEKGNIEALVDRLPAFGAATEVLFVEGHSVDGTWEEIQRIVDRGKAGFSLAAMQQSGAGKNDAVRLGMSRARHEVVVILDADLSVPPEQLALFYDAYRMGIADFVNGSRLVYPREGEAMRFLNAVANVFFAKALTYTLDIRITDSLCGTKLLALHDVRRMQRWRADFGDFDPFGDFELLFPAAILGLGVVDMPIRYRARTYGSTNIQRFRDGLRLFRMTMLAFFRIKTGRIPR